MSSSYPEEAFLDTSVCFNYTFDDDGGHARRLLPDHPIEAIVSDSVKREFESVKKRREKICKEVLRHAKRDEIEEFEPSNPDRLSDNDWAFVDRFTEILGPLDPVQVVRRINEKLNQLQTGYEDLFSKPDPHLSILPPQSRDGALMGDLRTRVANEADCRIICDAVEWCDADRGDHFLTSDKEDILGRAGDSSDPNGRPVDEDGGLGLPDSFLGFIEGDDRSRVEVINDVIERNYSASARLRFYSVPDFLSEYPVV